MKSRQFESYVDILRFRAETDPDTLAFYGLADLQRPHSRYTYAQADRRVRCLAAHLQAVGARGRRALIVLENDPDYVLSFLACNYAGVVGVTLNVPTHRKHAERLALVARDCGAGVLMTSANIAMRYRNTLAAADFPDLTWVIVEEVPDGQEHAWQPHAPRADDVAYLQYTSGSTGTPRGVVITHGSLMYQGDYMQRLFSITRRERSLTWLPLFHDMGLIVGALQPIYSGFPAAIARPSAFAKYPERWLRAISDLQITLAGGPNFLYDICADAVDPETIPGLDLLCWDIAFNAAEPIRIKTVRRFAERFGPYGFRPEAMNPGYGLAEATLAITIKPRSTPVLVRKVCVEALMQGRIATPAEGADDRELVSSGVFLPDTKVKIVDPEISRALPPDQVGEIWATSSGMPKRYWKQEDLSKTVFEASVVGHDLDYMRTGDLGFLDAAGNLFITGRLKDVLIFAGKNHYPQDIEETVEMVDPIIRRSFSAAISINEDQLEKLVVLAEIRNEQLSALDPRRLAARIRAEVADVHGVTVAQVVLLKQGQLPKTTSGKIQRRQCRELLLSGIYQRLDVAG